MLSSPWPSFLAPKTPAPPLAKSPKSTSSREENSSFAQEGNDVTMLPDGRFAVAPEGNYGSLARINFAKSLDGKWKTTL